ncbi:MAG: CinA family protein [Chloroflexota bacterium]|nr:CinA family protein [Chloroflexota bacterium]
MTAVSIAAQIGILLIERARTVCTAESCTGGLVAHRLTDIPGSSAYVLGGIVAYANNIKERLLGVPRDLLIAHGAVSAPVARAMAAGALERFGADYAISITGIAGPGGGSDDKPVGLTYIGLARRDDEGTIEVQQFVWSGDREANKASSADAALSWLLDTLAQES